MVKLTKVQKEIVRVARDLIADPEHWCWGEFAQTAVGVSCSWGSPDACRWCAEGALRYAAIKVLDFDLDSFETLEPIGAIAYPDSLTNINDNQGHAAVLKLFDEALAA